jgi:hypothetical protein
MDMEELRVKLELWKESWPELVHGALKGGTNLVKEEITRRWSGGVLQSRTGQLVRGLKTEVGLSPLHAKVFVDSHQQYKAQTHEQGRSINSETSKKGRIRRSGGKSPFLQISPPKGYYGRPRSVTIPARPVFAPSLETKKQEVIDLIKTTILEGYK